MAQVDLAARRRRWTWTLAPLGAPAAAAGLGALLLARRSLGTDEAAALEAARGPFGDVVENALEHDPAQAGYLALLRPVVALSDAEWAVRAPSVVAAALAALFAYWLGAQLFGRLAGIVTAGTLAANAALVAASQQARPYALAVAWMVLVTDFFVRALERESAWWWALYAVSVVALPLTHPIAASVLLAHGAVLVTAWRKVRARVALPALAFAGVEAALLLAAAAVDRADTPDGTGGLELGEVTLAFFRASGRSPVLLALAALGIGALVAGRVPGAEHWKAVLVGALVVAPAAALLLAGTSLPVYPERALVACAPGLALACGAAVAWIPRREIAWASVAAVAAVSAFWVVRWYAQPTAEDWRSAASAVAAGRSPRETVVVLPERSRPAYSYYAPSTPLTRRARGDGSWVLVRAADDTTAIEAGREVVDTPAFALREQRRFGDELVVQHWVRP